MKQSDNELRSIAESTSKRIDDEAIDITFGLGRTSSSYSATGAEPVIFEALRQVRDAQEARIKELTGLLQSAKKYIPYGAYKGNMRENKLDDIRLVNLVDRAIGEVDAV